MIARRSSAFVLVVVSVLLPVGCLHDEPARLMVAPPKVVPGDQLAIHSPDASFVDRSTIEVKFGDVVSRGIRVDDSLTIAALVPKLEPGPVKVVVRDGGDLVGEGEVTILRHPLLRLLLIYNNGDITLEHALDFNGGYGPVAESGRRVSYDVFDESGTLKYSGAVPHPAESTIEIFGDPARGETIQRVPRGDAPIHFLVPIPNLEGEITVRFFDAESGLDLTDPDDRADRTPIAEITIP